MTTNQTRGFAGGSRLPDCRLSHHGPCDLAGIIGHTLLSGLASLDLRFILEAPLKSGRAGGIGPIIVSTLIVTGIALVVAVPVVAASRCC